MLQLCWNALNSSGPPCTHVSGLAWDGWPRNGHEIMGNSRENRIIFWYPDDKIWHMRQRYASGERFWFSNSRKIMISNLAWGSSMAAALNDLKVDHCIWKWSKSKIDIYLAIKAETNHFSHCFSIECDSSMFLGIATHWGIFDMWTAVPLRDPAWSSYQLAESETNAVIVAKKSRYIRGDLDWSIAGRGLKHQNARDYCWSWFLLVEMVGIWWMWNDLQKICISKSGPKKSTRFEQGGFVELGDVRLGPSVWVRKASTWTW